MGGWVGHKSWGLPKGMGVPKWNLKKPHPPITYFYSCTCLGSKQCQWVKAILGNVVLLQEDVIRSFAHLTCVYGKKKTTKKNLQLVPCCKTLWNQSPANKVQREREGVPWEQSWPITSVPVSLLFWVLHWTILRVQHVWSWNFKLHRHAQWGTIQRCEQVMIERTLVFAQNSSKHLESDEEEGSADWINKLVQVVDDWWYCVFWYYIVFSPSSFLKFFLFFI